MARKFNHAFDFAFEVVSEHEDPVKIPAADIIAGLEKRLAAMKDNPAMAHDACNGFDVYEIEGFDDLSDADQRAQDESAFQSEQIANVRGEY
jgi:hypothetical protein